MRIAEQFIGRQGPAFARKLRRGGRGRSHQGIDARDTGYTQSIEGNIPDKLFPMGLSQVCSDLARYSRVAKHSRDVVHARLRPALKFSKHDESMIHVMN